MSIFGLTKTFSNSNSQVNDKNIIKYSTIIHRMYEKQKLYCIFPKQNIYLKKLLIICLI